MKKLLALLFLITYSILNYGQSFTGGISYGFAYPIAMSKLPDNLRYSLDDHILSYKHSLVKYSFAGGKQLGVSLNFQFSRAFGIGIEGSYLVNKGIDVKSTYHLQINTVAIREGKWTSDTYRLIPQIKFTGSLNDFDFYGKLGLAIGFSDIQYDETYAVKWYDTIRIVEQYTGDKFFGAMFALGIEKEIVSGLKIFGELKSITQTYSPNKKELIEMYVNDVDVLADKTKYERITEYVKGYELEDDLLGIFPDSENSKKETKIFFPFSSISFNFGIEYTFWKYKEKPIMDL